jgi:hypothetical protein
MNKYLCLKLCFGMLHMTLMPNKEVETSLSLIADGKAAVPTKEEFKGK